jgi:hypothetical protein
MNPTHFSSRTEEAMIPFLKSRLINAFMEEESRTATANPEICQPERTTIGGTRGILCDGQQADAVNTTQCTSPGIPET